MPSIEENTQKWNDPEVWNSFDLGESWSSEFGTTDILWYSYLYPRIHNFIDNKNVLEIAPGTGRITKYILPFTNKYVGYDLSQYCVNYSTTHYGDMFFVNDGKSFHNTEKDSVDFIFSWDSLVHVEKDVLFSYIDESLRCLKEDGVAFIHHSNFNKTSYGDNPHWRGNVSGLEIRNYILSLGGSVLIQEFITWDEKNGDYSDCITVFSKKRNFNFSGLNNQYFSIIRKENNKILSKYEALKPLDKE
jgi:SAM-dependent methyltransferase